MINEGEFWVLKRLSSKPVLVKEESESEEAFDLVCDQARDLLDRGIIHSQAADPFRRNNTLSGGRYLGAGRFDLSASALKIIDFEDFESFKRSIPKKSQWTLATRLTLFGLIVSIIAVVIALQ